MNFFEGHHFSMAGYFREHLGLIKNTPRYYGVQYNHAGGLSLRVNRAQRHIVEGAWAFVTHPGAYFEYGSVDNKPRQHHYICFFGERVAKYIESGLLPMNDTNPLIKINHPVMFQQTMLEIIAMVNADQSSHDRAVVMMEDLLLQLHEQGAGRRSPSRQLPLVEQLLDEIRAAPQRNWDFERWGMRIPFNSLLQQELDSF